MGGKGDNPVPFELSIVSLAYPCLCAYPTLDFVNPPRCVRQTVAPQRGAWIIESKKWRAPQNFEKVSIILVS